MVCFRHLKMRLATVNQKMIFDRLQKEFLNGIPDSLNESQCNSMVIVLLRSASVIGPEIVISELFFGLDHFPSMHQFIKTIRIKKIRKRSLGHLAYLQRL